MQKSNYRRHFKILSTISKMKANYRKLTKSTSRFGLKWSGSFFCKMSSIGMPSNLSFFLYLFCDWSFSLLSFLLIERNWERIWLKIGHYMWFSITQSAYLSTRKKSLNPNVTFKFMECSHAGVVFNALGFIPMGVNKQEMDTYK